MTDLCFAERKNPKAIVSVGRLECGERVQLRRDHQAVEWCGRIQCSTIGERTEMLFRGHEGIRAIQTGCSGRAGGFAKKATSNRYQSSLPEQFSG